MDEQRDGAIGRARQGLRFYARCGREAWRRSWDAANAIPTVLGLLVLYGGARMGGLDLNLSSSGDGGYGVLIGTGLFVALAWLAVFLVQLALAPPRLHARLEAELLALTPRHAPEPAAPIAALPAPAPAPIAAPILALPAASPPAHVSVPASQPVSAPRPALPSIEVHLLDQVHETAVDTTGAPLPASRAYVARIANRGDRRVRRCQIFFCNPTHIQVVSGPFDLGPGEHRDLPVLRVIDQADEPHALLYFLDGETWAVADGQAAWLPEPGRFKVKVLSANTPEAAIDVTLACSAGTPLAWTLVEAADVAETAPKAGRKRSAWAASDVAAEPSAGD